MSGNIKTILDRIARGYNLKYIGLVVLTGVYFLTVLDLISPFWIVFQIQLVILNYVFQYVSTFQYVSIFLNVYFLFF
jgi:hypothetical protein